MNLPITVIGTGYLGATHAVCMAELRHDVLGVDSDPAKIDRLAAAEATFYEAGLQQLLVDNVDWSLRGAADLRPLGKPSFYGCYGGFP